jgi:hypothetical protein
MGDESWCFIYNPEKKNVKEYNLVESKETESSGSENAEIAGENNVVCIF